MRRMVTLFLIVVFAVCAQAAEQKMIPRYNKITGTWASYPAITIDQLQRVPFDSLLVADAIQNNTSRWLLQVSPYNADTVVLTALCVVPAKIITYTNKGFTLLLYDTASTSLWRGVFARCSSDTAKHILDGVLNVEAGDIVQITGVISEFPTSSMNSLTQFQPIPGISIDIVGSMPIPPPVNMTAGDFCQGTSSGGVAHVRYSTGEPMEGMIVQLTGLTVNAKINTTRGTFSAVDVDGNEVSDYDMSRYFTLKGTSIDHPYPDTQWTRLYTDVVANGRKIDTIRGLVSTASGSENGRGYRIAPLYYGDVVFGGIVPSITTHRRYPVLVPSDSTPLVTCKSTSLSGSPLVNVILKYSVDGGPWQDDTMSLNLTDTTYRANIPAQSADAMVRYFITATDGLDNTAVLASAASGGASADTNRGYFFYTVTNRPYTVYDIQHTPFSNGRSPYVGGVVTIGGVVTVDTSSMPTVAGNTGWTNAFYMQTGNAPWNGIWIVGPDSLLDPVHLGDSIMVTGTVAEDFDVTRIQAVSAVSIVSSGNPVPAPVEMSTGSFGANAGNGSPVAEPYEGMLIHFTNVRLTNSNPTFSDPSEYEVDDGSGPVLVQHGGKNIYSNQIGDTLLGKTILYQGNTISEMTGVLYFSFNRYKFVPRTNQDFGVVTEVRMPGKIAVPRTYSLGQNYPNPFNPTTRFEVNLAAASHLTVEVFNLLGQKVATLVNAERPAGSYTIAWNGLSQDGRPAGSGIYFVRMATEKYTSVRKVMLMK